MGDKVASSPVIMAASSVGTPKKAAPAKLNERRTKPVHPKTAEMVNAAINEIKERGGPSLQAIKKYMVSTYKVDADKQSTFIKKYLKAAVPSGTLIQTEGKGAAGSFKLAAKFDTTKPKTKPAVKPKSPKKAPAAKKSAAAKKPSAAKNAAPTATIAQKKKSTKGLAAKPPKAKTTNLKPATKSPLKKAKPAPAKKMKPAPTKSKKTSSKKTTPAKK